MFPVSAPVMRAQYGFTLIEMVVVVAIFGGLMALGIPSMSAWVMSNKAAYANEFYMEGFRAARLQAIGHNAPSRIVLTSNDTTGQMDWQVDICFPVAGSPCTGVSGNWSTPTTAAANDPDSGTKYTSIKRSADILPSTSVIAPTLLPTNAYAVYYTALGWVDTSYANRLTRLQLDPLPAYAAQLPTTAIAITLAGMPIRCNVGSAVTDSRGCPP
ncbi:pilus assembly FimT family protein [Massilia sp. PWRC2]|uniref:pilus assembly FimT family protein n=1 Tax=Massilia sp. PWRC2 TaxID=2804626 RepID=UPI003CF1D51C